VRRALKWLGIVVGTLVCLVLLLGVGLYFFNWNWLRGALNAEGAKASGRQFAVNGDMGVHFFARHPWTPEIHLAQVQVGNPSWAKKPNMVQIGLLDFKIDLWQLLGGRIVMPELTLDTPVIDLEKPDADRKNWSMSSATPGGAAVNTTVPKNRTEVPVIGQLVVKNGTLSYSDAPSKLDVTTHVNTVIGSGGDNAHKTLEVKGNGTVQNEPFTVDMTGGSLLTLRDPNVRYPITFHLTAGPTVFDAKGTMTDPVNMAGIDMRLDVKGDSLAKIFPFTAIPLPPTPNFEISGHLTKEGDLWTFADFKGGVGHSDLEGVLKYDSSHAKPDITANLTSKLLDRQDLAGFVGAGPAQNPAQGGEKPKSQGVIPIVNILGTDKPTPLRCVVADFDVEHGMMVSKIFDIDHGHAVRPEGRRPQSRPSEVRHSVFCNGRLGSLMCSACNVTSRLAARSRSRLMGTFVEIGRVDHERADLSARHADRHVAVAGRQDLRERLSVSRQLYVAAEAAGRQRFEPGPGEEALQTQLRELKFGLNLRDILPAVQVDRAADRAIRTSISPTRGWTSRSKAIRRSRPPWPRPRRSPSPAR
jgi:hypothetical protein